MVTLGIVASRIGCSRNGRVRNGRSRIDRSRIGTSTALSHYSIFPQNLNNLPYKSRALPHWCLLHPIPTHCTVIHSDIL
jgi:hypothetical protein